MLTQPVYKELSYVLTALRVPELCSSALIFNGPSTCTLPEFYQIFTDPPNVIPSGFNGLHQKLWALALRFLEYWLSHSLE